MTDYTFPIMIAGEEMADERQMYRTLGRSLLMDSPESVRFIVLHCSATREDRDYTEEQLLHDHRRRGFRTGGYHFYLRKDGHVVRFRRLMEVGAHASGYNRCSIGVCYEGGLDRYGKPADTRTPLQRTALLELLRQLRRLFPQAIIVGHRDLPGVRKQCPCFESSEYAKMLPTEKGNASPSPVPKTGADKEDF